MDSHASFPLTANKDFKLGAERRNLRKISSTLNFASRLASSHQKDKRNSRDLSFLPPEKQAESLLPAKPEILKLWLTEGSQGARMEAL